MFFFRIRNISKRKQASGKKHAEHCLRHLNKTACEIWSVFDKVLFCVKYLLPFFHRTLQFVYPWSTKELTRTRSEMSCIPESNWNLEMLVFKERGKLEYPEKNLSEQSREPTTNSTHMTPGPGIEPGPHWWEASALTTAPTLLPAQMLELDLRHPGNLK